MTHNKKQKKRKRRKKGGKKFSREKQEIVKGMPNFDTEVFRRCTGINIADDGKRKRKKNEKCRL